MISIEERRARLRKRGEESARDRGQRNLGASGIKVPLDLSLAGQEIEWYELTANPRQMNMIDIVPFEVSTLQYALMRQYTGKPTGRAVGDWDYKLEICVHKKVGVSNSPCLCLREMFGTSCPICDDMFAEYKKRTSDSKNFNEKLAKSLQPQWRDVYKIYDYVSEKFKLWDVAYKTFEEYLGEKAMNSEEGYVTFADPWDGRVIEIEGRNKKIGEVEFVEVASLRFLKRSQPYEESDIKTFPLDKMLIIPTVSEVTQMYYCGESPAPQEQPSLPVENTQRRRSVAQPEEKNTNPCPAGKVFGQDAQKFEFCQNDCPQDIFDKCCNELDRISADQTQIKEPEPQQEKVVPVSNPPRRSIEKPVEKNEPIPDPVVRRRR